MTSAIELGLCGTESRARCIENHIPESVAAIVLQINLFKRQIIIY